MDDWAKVQLDDVADLSGGYAFKSSQYTDEGRFVLRTVNIDDQFSITMENANFISESEAMDFERFALQEHDTLFVMVAATLGKIGYIRERDLPALLNQNMWVIRAKEGEIEPVFLHYLFRQISKLPLSWVGGSARSFLRRDDVRKLEFDLPSPIEQDRIAHVLKTLDDKIELNRRMNETLEEMARALFRDWFVDFGPTRRQMEGATDPAAIMGQAFPPPKATTLAPLFPAKLGDDGLPEGWEQRVLYDLTDWVNGAAYKNTHFSTKPDALPVIKIAELKAGVTKTTKHTNTALGDKYRIRNGEVLFSWSGNPDTSIDTFIWSGGDAWLNQHIFAVRPNGEVHQAVLYFLLKYLRPQFAEIARDKQTTGLGHVTKQDLKAMRVCLGSDEVESAATDIFSPLFAKLYANQQENQTLAEMRDLLLPKLMSGEVRLKDAEAV